MICFSSNYLWAKMTSGVFMLVVIGHPRKTKLHELFYWLLIRVTLVVAFGFCPKILGGARTYKSFFCHSMNAGSMMGIP